jgi:hypothetical protein
MGAVIPAILAHQDAGFTPLDHDEESLVVVSSPVRVVRETDHQKLRRGMAASALAMMDRAGVNLLDADFDPWTIGTPACRGYADHRPVEPSAEQMQFIHTLESVRNIIATNTARPLTAFTAVQDGPTPKDAILLNMLFYLSTDGHLVEPKVEAQPEGTFAIHVVVR